MTLICTHCKGQNILQEASIMLNPNKDTPDAQKVLDDMEWNDYYYCEDCEDGTEAEETEE